MKERRKMSLMKNNTTKILAFLMAMLMIIQLMPFTSLAEDDPDSVETSEILETFAEDDFDPCAVVKMRRRAFARLSGFPFRRS